MKGHGAIINCKVAEGLDRKRRLAYAVPSGRLFYWGGLVTNRANTDILRQPTADAWGRNGAPAYVWEGLMGSWSPPVRACLRCLGGDCRRCSADPLTMSERARVGEPGTVRYL